MVTVIAAGTDVGAADVLTAFVDVEVLEGIPAKVGSDRSSDGELIFKNESSKNNTAKIARIGIRRTRFLFLPIKIRCQVCFLTHYRF